MRWMNITPLALLMTLGITLGWPAAGHGDEEATGAEAQATEPAEAAEEPSILDVPLDGTSKESFDAGMERVKTEASAAEYDLLQRAIGLISNYDLAIRSNSALLYARMDGKTPREIIDIARERYRL